MKQLYLLGIALLCFSDIHAQVRRMSAIGSSTTGGTGAFPADSGWVRRFSNYYKNQLGIIDTAYRRGVGGYSCYKGMPTGYVPPPNRPGPDGNNNITRALIDLSGLADPEYGVVIISYPSNGYDSLTIPEIMFCLQTMYDIAINAGHKCYVTTSQPRTDANFALSVNKRKLADIKDSIINRFGVANTLNFYDGMINPADSSILPIYSAGDNIHYNNAGHRVLFERVVAKDVFNMALPVTISHFSAALKQSAVELQWTAHHDDPNTYFLVQRSRNGIQFESLQNISANNNSGGAKMYRYTDNDPIEGIGYYRLEIHEPGKKYFSTTITVNAKEPALRVQRLYPTLASGSLTLEIYSAQTQTTTLEIINSNGSRVKTFTRLLNRDKNIVQISVAGLAAGNYFLRISNPGSAPVIQTFVKQDAN